MAASVGVSGTGTTLFELREAPAVTGRIAWPLRPGGPLKANEREVLFKAWQHLMLGRSEPRSLSALDETSGVKIDEVRATLAKMAPTQKAARGGYASDEGAGLFDRLDDQAEPRFPPFLVRLIEGLLDGSDHRWTLGKAEEQWFWGYLWEGAAGKKDVYEDWLALACDIGFAAREPEVGKAEPGYRLVTTADLGGYLKAASNWFEQTLPGLVARMEDVFGERKVRGYFDPREGTETRAARKLLADAGQELESLKLREDNRRPEQSVEERAGVVAGCARLRTDIDQKVRLVYDQDGFGRLGGVEEVTALSFEDRVLPLWQKVGLAARFAEFVLRVQAQILRRILTLRQEMETQVKPLTGFPLQLFVRSLEKVGNILSGAVRVGRKDGSTQRIQAQEADTLGYYLQDLDIAQSREKLRRLAGEVGVSFSGPETPLAQIDAPIAKGFRDLVAAYGQERADLVTLGDRIAALDKLLADPPASWTYPTTVPPISELRRHADHVRGELEESLAEDAEGLLAEHDRPARTANFTPLMQAAQNLVHGPRMALARLGSQVLTLENAVAGFRRGLLAHPDLRETEAALNALLRARGEPARAPLGLPDVEKAGPLRAAEQLVAERRTEWVEAGEKLLAETAKVSTTIWLSGTLAAHRRGRFLRDLLVAEPSVVGLPQGHGMCLAFAADFQDADEAEQLRWLAWTVRSGRVVLLVPPLRPGAHPRPAEWRVEAMTETGVATEGSLPAVLAPEVRHCLAGRLQTPDAPAGKWAGGRAHTVYHRQHPAAGTFTITCLPLWSPALLGQEALVKGWLTDLYQLAGAPAATEAAPAGMSFSPDHWAVLLHLCANRFAGPDEAVETLTRSPLFQVPPDRGRECLAELEAGGFAAGGRATETGRSALLASPYAAYLEALEATNA